MMSFALYILASVISIQFVSSQPAPPAIPVCDGSQVIYATPPSTDPLTGMITAAGLDAITLSDGINTFVSNRIGIASDITQMVPEQPMNEIIRSAAINPMTSDLVLLYQEIDIFDPTMSEPNQRLVIIPGFKLKSLLSESPTIPEPAAGEPAVDPQAAPQRPGILGYEMLDQIDLSEVEIGDQIPLTEIAFDCAANLLGVTMEGEMVQMIIEPGSSNVEYNYIGQVKFEGAMIELSQGFVGLTYDFQTNTFVTIGGMGGHTLVQFQVNECIVMQIGDPIIITDIDNLCVGGITDIESRGNNQYYVACVDAAAGGFGLAILELQGSVANILPLNAAEGKTLVALPNSSGGALIPSIPSTTGNGVCFPRSIATRMCNVPPADTDCEGDIEMQQVFPPWMAAPGAAQGAIPAAPAVAVGPVNGQVGLQGLQGVPQINGAAGGHTYGYDAQANGGHAYGQYSNINGAAGGYDYAAQANAAGYAAEQYGTSFNGETVAGTDTANVAHANAVLNGEGSNWSSSSGGSGSSGDSGSGSGSGSSSGSASGSGSGSGSDDSSSSSSSSDSTDSSSGDSGSDDDSSGSGSSDDSDSDSDDDSGSNSSDGSDSDDDEDGSDDGVSDDGNSLDDDGDESDDDDLDSGSSDSVERGSAEDAQSYGNEFNRNGFVAADYNSNEGNVISLSSSTLANLWGLAMIFLGINVTFLFICYYRNGNCRKNQVTIDDDMDADVESL